MNKNQPPTTLGVFKPVGHTVMAFRTDSELQAAVLKLGQLGFPADSIVSYSAVDMVNQVDGELQSANVLANFGYELDLIRAHRDLAMQGCGFLVVEARTEALAEQVAQMLRDMHPATAQHYGRFMIEDLTEKSQL